MTVPQHPQPKRHVDVAQRTYPKRRKIEVLLYLENHRIPLELDRFGFQIQPSGSQMLAGASPVEEGFRRPFLKEAAAYFKISGVTTVSNWWTNRVKILGDQMPIIDKPKESEEKDVTMPLNDLEETTDPEEYAGPIEATELEQIP